MAPQRGFDFSTGPEKVFVDTAHMRIIGGLLHICVESGREKHTYLLPLPLAKQVSRAIARQIEEIEKKQGVTIEGRLPNEPLVSPFTHGSADSQTDSAGDDTPDDASGTAPNGEGKPAR